MSSGIFESRRSLQTVERRNHEQIQSGSHDSEYNQGSFADDEFNLREYLNRVRRHKWTVVLITAVLTGIAAIYLLNLPSVFQAEARVQVNSESEVGFDGRGSVSPFEDRAYFNTQLELLESPDFIRTIVEKLRLDKNREFVSGFASSNLQSGTDDLALAEGRENQNLTQLVDSIIDSLKVEPVLQTRQTVKDTRLISIKFRHRDANSSAQVANAVADQLVASNLDQKLQTNTSELAYLQNNIAELKSLIQLDEERLLAFGRNYQLPSSDDTQNIVIERLSGLNRQLLEAENERKQAEAAYRSSLNPGVAATLAEMNAKQINDIDAKLDDLRQKRAQLLVEVTEKHPEVREMDKQIGVLENSAAEKRERATNMLKTSLEARYREAVSREDAIRKSVDQQWGQTLQQNYAAISYRKIQQDMQTNRKLLDEMQQREKENEMLKAKSPNNIRVVDYAMTPSDPLDQKSAQNLGLAFLFSFAIGIGGALLKDYFDDSVHSQSELERTLNLPSLAAIPQVRTGLLDHWHNYRTANPLPLSGERAIARPYRSNGKLILDGYTNSPLYEAFRHLRTVLTLSPEVGNIKKLLITSCRQAEGKTTTAVNIATSLSQTGATVLLIDADLRNPQLHKILKETPSEGLSDLLTSEIEPAQAYIRIGPQNANLHFLAAGTQSFDRAECLDSDRMRDLLEALDSQFDYIVIDSPPVMAFADSSILAAMADGVLLVVQENRNTVEVLRQTRRALDLVGANVVGIVLNKTSSNNSDYGYRYRN